MIYQKSTAKVDSTVFLPEWQSSLFAKVPSLFAQISSLSILQAASVSNSRDLKIRLRHFNFFSMTKKAIPCPLLDPEENVKSGVNKIGKNDGLGNFFL